MQYAAPICALSAIWAPPGVPPQRRVVWVSFARRPFFKSEGKTYSDSKGEYRWITVHPGGSADKGTPVKLRRSKNEPNMWHVVAGAGGKLNYLKIPNLKSPEEYKEAAAEKRRIAKEKAKDAAAQIKMDRADMSPEELERTKAEDVAKADAKKKLAEHVEVQKREFIAKIAEMAGWKDDEWKFDATRARLEMASADPDRIAQIEKAHFKRVYTRARDVVKAAKRRLLIDAEQRAEAELGELPMRSADPNVIALSDLDPDKPGKGLGYRRDVSKLSDGAITQELAKEDAARLRKDLEDARDAYNPDRPSTEGHIVKIAAELRAAEVLLANADKAPEELQADEERLVKQADAVRVGMTEYLPELRLLATQDQKAFNGKAPPLDEEQDARLNILREEFNQDRAEIEKLNEQLVDVQVMQGKQPGVVKGAKVEIQRRATEEREDELRFGAESDEEGEEKVMRRRMFIAKLQGGLAMYRAEISGYRAAGVITKPDLPSVTPDSGVMAAEILKHAKALDQFDREAKKELAKGIDEKIDTRVYGTGYFTETRSVRAAAAVEREVNDSLVEQRTRSFLEMVEEADRNPSLADLTDQESRDSMQRHISAGSFNALNNASITIAKQALLGRDAVDVLGSASAARVMARALKARLNPEDVSTIADALGDYHLKNHMEASEEAVRNAQSLYDQAAEIELGASRHPGDLLVQQELNAKRRELDLEARSIMGRTLGEMEALAALHVALKASPDTEVHVNLGPIAVDAAVKQARAIGLGRDDFAIESDGTNRFLTVNEAGMDKLVKPVDADEMKIHDEVVAIKRGERDEDNYVPAGLTKWPATTFDVDSLEEAPSLGIARWRHRPAEKWGQIDVAGGAGRFAGTSGNPVEDDIANYIGAQAADGRDPNLIVPGVLTCISKIPNATIRKQAFEYLDKVMPQTVPMVNAKGKPVYRRDSNGEVMVGEDGNPIQDVRRLKGSDYEPLMQRLAEQAIAKFVHVEGKELVTFHGQGLKTSTPEDATKTAKAIHMALASDPRAVAAFKPLGELGTQDQAALRQYFGSHVAKIDTKSRADQKRIRERIDALGPEPEKESVGFFGKQDNPMWSQWAAQARAILADESDRGSAQWEKYVRLHHGVSSAYESLQDKLKGDFLERFSHAYAGIHGDKLRIGKRDIRGANRHAIFLDPSRRDAQLEKEAKLRSDLQARSRGKYARGTVKERMDQVLQADEIDAQQNVSLLPVDQIAATTPEAGRRLSIGRRAEAQVASLIGGVAKNFSYATDQPISLAAKLDMNGENIARQRTIKAFLAAKRYGAYLGVGSGKTVVALGGFTAAASDPKTGVKRGLFLVPSSVQGQFHGEIARFVEPGGKFNWNANPGASWEERHAVYRDPNTHMVVLTHQGFRDDQLRMLAEHWGTSKVGAQSRFGAMSRKERARAIREVWDKQGMDFQASFIDENHGTLDRKGKEDSMLSQVLQAVSDNTPYMMAMTADPEKNDVSEIRSQLDKMFVDERYSNEQEWHKRYGQNTSASRDALQREVRGRFTASSITPNVEVRKEERGVALHPKQKAAYARAMETYNRIRSNRAKGVIDVEGAKELSPNSFAGAPPEEHEKIARRLTDNIGIIKEAALNRIINLAPTEENAKVQAIVEHLKTHPVRDKPVVVFAHNLAAVEQIEKALTAAGHRVATLTGALSGRERDARRKAFQPEKGTGDPTADVLVMSDAGATGLNLQRGQTMFQYDTPMTDMIHEQRNGRIYRTGQKQGVDLIDLVTDTPFEARARARMATKHDLRSIFTDPGDDLDDRGLAGFISRARQKKSQIEDSKLTRLAA